MSEQAKSELEFVKRLAKDREIHAESRDFVLDYTFIFLHGYSARMNEEKDSVN